MNTVDYLEAGGRFAQKHHKMDKAAGSFPSDGGNMPKADRISSLSGSKRVSKVTSDGNTTRPRPFSTSRGNFKVRAVQQHRGMVVQGRRGFHGVTRASSFL